MGATEEEKEIPCASIRFAERRAETTKMEVQLARLDEICFAVRLAMVVEPSNSFIVSFSMKKERQLHRQGQGNPTKSIGSIWIKNVDATTSNQRSISCHGRCNPYQNIRMSRGTSEW